MTSHHLSRTWKRGVPLIAVGSLRALQLTETVGDGEPFSIVPILQRLRSAVPLADTMAANVRWAERGRYTILTRDIPASLAPYNAMIRFSERGTEDRQRDNLAHLVLDQEEGL